MSSLANFNLPQLAQSCSQASRQVSRLSSTEKNNILQKMADYLIKDSSLIINANNADLEQAKKNQLSPAMIDRLVLNSDRLDGMAEALREIALLPDPVGEISSIKTRPNGIQVGYMRIPLGVIAIIYESRPNVTSDAAGLCLKAGNTIILRGGSEAFFSNQAIVAALHQALRDSDLPTECISFVPTRERQAMTELLKLEYLQLIRPSKSRKSVIAKKRAEWKKQLLLSKKSER